MANSQYLTILQRMKQQVDSLDLVYNGAAVSVSLQKIAQWLTGVGQAKLPVVLLALDDKPESVVPWSSEDEVLVKYNTALISVAPGNRDNTANMDLLLQWREQERRLFQWGLQPQITSAFFAEVVANPPILRDAVFKNYDVSGLGFRIWNVEPRTNLDGEDN